MKYIFRHSSQKQRAITIKLVNAKKRLYTFQVIELWDFGKEKFALYTANVHEDRLDRYINIVGRKYKVPLQNIFREGELDNA